MKLWRKTLQIKIKTIISITNVIATLWTSWVMKYFPPNTCLSWAQGHFMLWVELPHGCNTQRLTRWVLPLGVQVVSGLISSASGEYRNCLRLSYSKPMTTEIERAVQKVGKTIYGLLAETESPQVPEKKNQP